MAKQKYAWDEWFIQGHFTLKQGVDYSISQSAMSQSIRNNASMRGLRVNIEDMGNSIVVNVIGIGKNGLSHTDKTTVATEHESSLEKDESDKEETKGSDLLHPKKRTVPKTSSNSNNNKTRPKKTR